MTYWQRARFSVLTTSIAAILLLLWTLLHDAVAFLDEIWRAPVPSQTSASGQILSTFHLITAPPVVIGVMVIAAWWAKSRRLNAIAGAIVMASTLTWAVSALLKTALGRPRPDSPWDYLITQQTSSYPSGHAAAIASAAILMVALTSTTRRTKTEVWTWRLVGIVAVAAVCLSQLILHSHYVTDLVGGILVGTFITTFSLLICDVHTFSGTLEAYGRGRAAIIYNPAKIPDPTTFMRLVDSTVADLGWDPPVWLATTPSDPGHAMARTAREGGVDLVMVAGGDGTVRIVCGELANSGIRLAIIPAGTGNLLARNLEIPLDYDRALRLLTDGEPKPLDVVRFTSDDDPDLLEFSVVMAGVGADAAIMQDTDEHLKRQIGSLAYFAAGVNHIKAAPMRATMSLDGQDPEPIDASLVSIGNVSDLQGGLTIMPGASASDGLMDVMVASPTTPAEIAQMLGAVLTRPDQIPHLTRHTAKVVELHFEEPVLFQIDGDVIGEVRHLKAETMHHVVDLLRSRRENLLLG